MQQLDQALEQLLSQLEQLNAPVLLCLQPGLDLPTIQTLLAELPLYVPDELYQLFQWRNGVHEDQADQQLFPDGSFFSLETVIQEYQQQLAVARQVAAYAQLAPEEIWRSEWLPLFGTATGDLYVVPCGAHAAASAPILLIENDTRTAVQIYDDLAGMIAAIAECYQRGVYTLEQGEVRCAEPHLAARIAQAHNPRSAHWLMSQAGDAKTADDLVRALHSDDATLREKASQALLQLRDRQAVAGLIASLRATKPAVRSLAARLLGGLGDTSAADALIASLGDSDAGVRSASAQAVGELQTPQAAGPLLQLLHDDDPAVQVKSIWALGQLGDSQAVDPLLGLLGHASPSLRLEAVKALGAIGDRRAIPALLQALRDPWLDLQQLAAWALGELRDPAALSALRVLLQHHDPLLRSNVRTAIEKITHST